MRGHVRSRGSTLLRLMEVEKEYSLTPVLNGVDLCLEAGRTYLLSAPNGSGKTTLLQIMAGLIKPSRGKVLWNDRPFDVGMRGEIGVVFQAPLLYGDLTGFENLLLFAALNRTRNAKERARLWMDRLDLRWAADLPVREYSKGMRQRLSIGRSMIHDPSVLLLDEPFDGLDGESTQRVQAMFSAQVAQGVSVFMVTHQVQHLPGADYHMTLRHGRLVDSR